MDDSDIWVQSVYAELSIGLDVCFAATVFCINIFTHTKSRLDCIVDELTFILLCSN